MEFFNQLIILYCQPLMIINNEFERVTYTEAIALLKSQLPPSVSCQVGLDLQSEHSATWLSSCLKAGYSYRLPS